MLCSQLSRLLNYFVRLAWLYKLKRRIIRTEPQNRSNQKIMWHPESQNPGSTSRCMSMEVTLGLLLCAKHGGNMKILDVKFYEYAG